MNSQDISYTDILCHNKEFSKELTGTPYVIKVLSNIVTFQITDILEYALRSESIPAHVQCGNYDTIVQDSQSCQDENLVIVFWELANCVDGLQYKVNLFSESDRCALREKIIAQIDLTLSQLTHLPLVLFNTFSTLVFNGSFIVATPFDILKDELNTHLKSVKPKNTILIDTDKIIAQTGISASVDLRYYHSSKALYSIDFYRNYVDFITPAIRAVNGKTKKALIFDCDNTLWHGTVGEDGVNGIETSALTKNGAAFEEIQYLARYLNQQGTLIGLCSKNNPEDVDHILNTHPDMLIQNRHVSIKKVNWLDKVSNLRDIAKELNINTDSLVMIDDSPFELEYIASNIPEITTLQVPDKKHLYPSAFRKNMRHFFSLSHSSEDSSKTTQYAQQFRRNESKAKFACLEDYLSSLQLCITLHKDNPNIIARMAQLTQKTNQFNLTTKRYTENDISQFITNPLYSIYACEVKDRFGDSGITGLCIITTDEHHKNAVIDSFMLSCRVIGRNIEYAFLDTILSLLKESGIQTIQAEYCETPKNQQVKYFYKKCGWVISDINHPTTIYSFNLDNHSTLKPNYIEVRHARKN